MANIPTNGNEIIVDTPESVSATALQTETPKGSALTSWVISRVKSWEDQRERGYGRLWGEYWRIWRGRWKDEDKNRKSERSRIVAPATAQAIEAAVSEIEEAIFSKEVWFDIVDDIGEEDRQDAISARDLLLQDFERVNAKDALGESVLNGAIFGTGIIQVHVEVRKDYRPVRDPNTGALSAGGRDRVYVCFESIRPDQFIPDPSALNIQDMLGCAVRRQKPRHSILEKIKQGTYRKEALPHLFGQPRTDNNDIDLDDPQSSLSANEGDQVDVIEYHGKVPLGMLSELAVKKTELDEILDSEPVSDTGEELVEAIVTIANGSVLLRARATPFVMGDRSIIAFQYEKVPGRFWGRGVAEKGYNPQKALDATIRSYLDALGYVASPMLGIDSGRIPRSLKLEVHPGKVWTTQGPPDEVLRPVQIGQLDVSLFQVAADMERMVQMGTGQMDTASALKSQSQSGASGLSSNSFMMGAFVKRSKRAIANIDRNLLQPAITKAMWRYMQFDGSRYPKDYDFTVKATLGIMAREVEVAQLTQTMAMIPEQFAQVKLMMAQGILEHSALSNKAEILKAANKALAPPDPETQKRQKELSDAQYTAALAEAQGILLENQKRIAEIKKLLAESLKISHSAGVEDEKQRLETDKVRAQLLDLDVQLQTIQQQSEINRKKLEQQDRALDIKEQELEIKRKQANKPATK